MAVKETPTSFRVYYASMINATKRNRTKALCHIETFLKHEKQCYELIKDNIKLYKIVYNIDLNASEEFVKTHKINTKLFNLIEATYNIYKNDSTNIVELYNLYKYALAQKNIVKLKKKVATYDKMLCLKVIDYKNILEKFYTEVHRKLILEGAGYAFEGLLGWICINRCRILKRKPMLDFAATKANKEKLIAEGKRLYNVDEAKWCKDNGIEYDGVEYRIYKKDDYCYEVPLIDCHVKNGTFAKLTLTDRRGREIRGLSNKELIEKYKTTDNIINLPLGLMTKLTLCLELNNLLYHKYIRNENQKPFKHAEAGR